jgi:UDP-glucose 4-epimerase
MGFVVVTGASGFIGKEVCRRLVAQGHAVRAIVRRPGSADVAGQHIEESIVGDLGDCLRNPAIFAGADAVVHLAARVHRDGAEDVGVDAVYHRENAELTKALAETAQLAGVRRFVFMSSVKALGERSGCAPLRCGETPRPEDAYGRSKLAAEQLLAQVSAASGLEIAIIRSPLVYGPEARANFRTLVRAIERGVPLPFAAVENRRSIVSVWNLADFVVRCLGPLPATSCVFHVADPRPVSTPELMRLIGAGLGRKARMVSVPTALLGWVFRATGRGAWVDRLLGSLELDTSQTFTALGWVPLHSVDDGIMRSLQDRRQ